jgi:diaminopimelate decarboxylase
MTTFKEELKALFEKYDVVFDIVSRNEILFITNNGIDPSEVVELNSDHNAYDFEKASERIY